MKLEIEHGEAVPSVAHITLDRAESTVVLADAVALSRNVGPDAHIWLHGSTEERDEMLADAGYVTDRALLQMRVTLPVESPSVATTPLKETDIDELIAVNNRAFHWHPEQSGLTRGAFDSDRSQDWFEPEGVRLHRIDGALAGFCWTKIHEEPEALGEIYVIAVDPAFHGRGLGKPVTMAGLDWLTQQGLTIGMLYVESDNGAAVATYRGLGFDTHRIDRLWTPA
ncbi:MAG: mycothiol synthase [Acidimicrobiales bacterium]